jgi:hypothetical protein
MLDGDTYPASFEGPPLQRSERQTHRPFGHRGRPGPHPLRLGESLELVEPFRTPPSQRQSAANRSWLNLGSLDTIRANPSLSLGSYREEVRREIENLVRKLTYLKNNFASYYKVDTKYNELLEKLISLEDRF